MKCVLEFIVENSNTHNTKYPSLRKSALRGRGFYKEKFNSGHTALVLKQRKTVTYGIGHPAFFNLK